MFSITLFEARGLRNVDPMARQDPYVQIALGATYVKKSSVVRDGGTQPYFAEEELLVFADSTNW
jgi:Ca2+-dependent lipid-binding protein